jgi:hypothetical protein
MAWPSPSRNHTKSLPPCLLITLRLKVSNCAPWALGLRFWLILPTVLRYKWIKFGGAVVAPLWQRRCRHVSGVISWSVLKSNEEKLLFVTKLNLRTRIRDFCLRNTCKRMQTPKIKLNLRRWSDIKCRIVCYIWPACDISMWIANIGTSGRGEVTALVSLFASHVSKRTSEQNGRCDWKLFQVWGQAEEVNQSEINRRLLSDLSQNIFSQKEVSVLCNKFKDGRTTLNDGPEKHTDRSSTLMKILFHCPRYDKGRSKNACSWNSVKECLNTGSSGINVRILWLWLREKINISASV